MKPLYGLADLGDRWHAKLKDHFLHGLRMIPKIDDKSLYEKHICSRLEGNSGIYVNDVLETGSEAFMSFTEKTLERKEKNGACSSTSGLVVSVVQYSLESLR